MMTTEVRNLPSAVEWRETDSEHGELAGVAIRYGDVAALPWGKERFEPGSVYPAATGVILNRQHDRSKPLARYPGSGLELSIAPEGIGIRASVANTSVGRDTVELVKQGVLKGLSVEFVPEAERSEGDVRVIERAKLVGIAIVDDGAYADSTIKHMRAREIESGRGRPIMRMNPEWL